MEISKLFLKTNLRFYNDARKKIAFFGNFCPDAGMSYFSTALNAALEGIRKKEFSKKSGIDPPAISDFCNGKRLPDSRLGKILEAVAARHRLPILLAYLRDTALERGKKFGILPTAYTIEQSAAATRIPYPPGLEEDFETILRHLHTPEGAHYAPVFKELAAAFRADGETTVRQPAREGKRPKIKGTSKSEKKGKQ